MARQKLIIDCDAGIDDASALLMALEAHKAGEIEVLALTAVYGNTDLDCVLTNILRTLDVAKCPEVIIVRFRSTATEIATTLKMHKERDCVLF